MKSILAVISVCVCLTQFSQAQLLAEVRTSAGNFSINLNFTGAPRTVSHFMRLANGTQPWLNEKTGRVVTGTPFYNGLTFHKRVDEAPPFHPVIRRHIQTGARFPGDIFIRQDNQGAGFVMRDEIRSGLLGNLLVPHVQYTVSMANMGPHTSSSQFLITLLNDTALDGKNSAFGIVNQLFVEYDENGVPISSSNGRAVVNAIHASFIPTTIHSITFRRLGIAANQFDENDASVVGEQALLRNLGIANVAHDTTQVTLTTAPVMAAQVRLYSSPDLNAWTYAFLSDVYTSAEQATSPQIVFNHGGSSRHFFRFAGAAYPQTASPADLLGKIVFVGRQTPESIRFIFDMNGVDAVYQLSDGSTGALTYTYTRVGPFRGDLAVVNTPGLPRRIYRLYFGGTNSVISTSRNMVCEIVDIAVPGVPVTDSTFTISDL